MFNTEVPKNTFWRFDDARNGFVVIAHRDIKAGEQCFDSYGKKCNYRFFLYYGFIHPNNEKNNEYHLAADLTPQTPLFDSKIKCILGTKSKAERIFKIKSEVKSILVFLSWARLIVFDGDVNSLKGKIEKFKEEILAADTTTIPKWIFDHINSDDVFVP